MWGLPVRSALTPWHIQNLTKIEMHLLRFRSGAILFGGRGQLCWVWGLAPTCDTGGICPMWDPEGGERIQTFLDLNWHWSALEHSRDLTPWLDRNLDLNPIRSHKLPNKDTLQIGKEIIQVKKPFTSTVTYAKPPCWVCQIALSTVLFTQSL